jgi:hypothetical protein
MLDRQAFKAKLVLKVNKVSQGQMARKVLKVCRDLKATRELQVLRDRKDRLGQKDRQAW